MGPAPAVAEVRHAVRRALAELGNTPLFVACSGGADSLALACAVAFERDLLRSSAGSSVLKTSELDTPGRPITGLVTVDHRLQNGSAAQARRVAGIGYELGFDPVLSLPVDVLTKDGPEADARSARYGALDAVASAFGAWIMLGHTLDDQAETVLLGLGRGSGPRSLAGMSPRNGHYARPLLSVRRVTTVAACSAWDLPVWNDPHNTDERYARVGLRRVMPALETVLQGGVAESLARTAELVRADLEALDTIAAQRYASLDTASKILSPNLHIHRSGDKIVPDGLDIGGIADEPAALRQRIVRLWIADILHPEPPALTGVHYDAIEALVTRWHGQGAVDLPGGFVLWRESGRLRLAPRTAIR